MAPEESAASAVAPLPWTEAELEGDRQSRIEALAQQAGPGGAPAQATLQLKNANPPWSGPGSSSLKSGLQAGEGWQPKPGLTAYEQLLFDRWRTDERLTTDAAGRVELRVFRGVHEVRVAGPSGASDLLR